MEPRLVVVQPTEAEDEDQRDNIGGGTTNAPAPPGRLLIYDDISAARERGLLFLDGILREIADHVALHANAGVEHRGKALMIDKKTPFRKMTLTPMMDREQSEEEVVNAL